MDIEQSLDRLESYLEAQRFRGWDPYDALTSPIFRLPILRSSKWLRLAAQQLLKRSPYNFRPLLRIPEGYNPVTLAFVLEGSVYRAQLTADERHRRRAEECVRELTSLCTPGYSGACWGYPFDWEARYGRLQAGTPTIVATGIVTNALFTAHRLLELGGALELCASAARFVVDDLPRTSDGDAFCWGYHPDDTRRVLNATMKGARLCAQISLATHQAEYGDLAARTVRYVVRHQREDGSWPYAVGDSRQWADNFHTAYVLDALDCYERCTGDTQFSDAKKRGWRYYRTRFFRDETIPRYYPAAPFPVDATASAQSLLTLCRFGDLETAGRVASWAIDKMQCEDGHFAYQVRRRGVVRVPYMRWSSAYMYAGLSRTSWALTSGTESA